MLGFNVSENTKLFAATRGVARWGTVCGVFAMLLLVTGCPIAPSVPCPDDGSPCNDNNACTTDSCDAETNLCVFAPLCAEGESCADGVCFIACETAADCDDSDVCTADACTDGACGNTAIADCCEADADCNDGNGCTDDACDVANNTCTYTNNTAACDDGSVCTENDACADGACAGTAIDGCCETDADCDTAAGETCTVDNVCEAACVDDADCDDGDNCTDDTCVNGACDNTAVDCGDEVCNPGNGECVECVDNADCDDGFACTTDFCNSGNFCDNIPSNVQCDDFLFCTGEDICDPEHPDADADGCWSTGDECGGTTPICNESTDDCDACANASECDDGFSCTTDICDESGACINDADNAACDDGLYCTENDICDPENENADETSGCVNEGDPCDVPVVAGFFSAYKLCNEGTDSCDDCTSNADCDDGIGCTRDVCNAVDPGVCSNESDSDLCDDGLFCTEFAECCPDCDDADADGCLFYGDPCGGQLCEELANDYDCVACVANAECDDGVACTDDICDGFTGECSNVPNNDNCSGGEFCDPDDGCVEK